MFVALSYTKARLSRLTNAGTDSKLMTVGSYGFHCPVILFF